MSRILRFGSMDSLDANLHEVLRDGYIALIPAETDHEVNCERIVDMLVQSGCKELCFVGGLAEYLHDEADSILEKSMLLKVVTTACSDELEAIDYFLYGAGGGESDMLALVDDWPALKMKLLKAISSTEGGVVVQ